MVRQPPSFETVDAQFNALFGGALFPPIAAPAPRAHEIDADGRCVHCGRAAGDDIQSLPCA